MLRVFKPSASPRWPATRPSKMCHGVHECGRNILYRTQNEFDFLQTQDSDRLALLRPRPKFKHFLQQDESVKSVQGHLQSDSHIYTLRVCHATRTRGGDDTRRTGSVALKLTLLLIGYPCKQQLLSRRGGLRGGIQRHAEF